VGTRSNPSRLNKVMALANQKGGVGKTTSCVNLAASLHASKQKVLLIDLDPQGNATMGSGVDKSNLSVNSNDVLLGTAKIEDAIIKGTPGGYDLLPANSDLTAAEISLVNQTNRERKLKDALQRIKGQYDFILLDCPPSLNMLTLNALVAADSLLIPMQCEYYALEGLSALLNTMEQVKHNLNPALYVEGIIQTMYDPRNRLALDVVKQLKSYFPNKVYKSAIPRNVRLAEAPSHGVPVLLYDKSSRGSTAYLALAGEILKQQRKSSQDVEAELESDYLEGM
jgi:chromosome partitioning protein